MDSLCRESWGHSFDEQCKLARDSVSKRTSECLTGVLSYIRDHALVPALVESSITAMQGNGAPARRVRFLQVRHQTERSW